MKHLLYMFFIIIIFFTHFLSVAEANQESTTLNEALNLAVSVSDNKTIAEISSSITNSETWLKSHVLSLYPSTKITTIVVSSSSSSPDLVLSCLKNLHHSLIRWGLEKEIKVSLGFQNSENTKNLEMFEPVLVFLKSINSTFTIINPSLNHLEMFDRVNFLNPKPQEEASKMNRRRDLDISSKITIHFPTLPSPSSPENPNPPISSPIGFSDPITNPNSPISPPTNPNPPISQPRNPNFPVSSPIGLPDPNRNPNSPISQPTNPNSPISQPRNPNSPITQPRNPNPPISSPIGFSDPFTNPNSPISSPSNPNPPISQPRNPNPPISQPRNPNPPISQPPTNPNSPISQPTNPNSPISQPRNPNSPISQPRNPNSPNSQPINHNSPISQPRNPNSPIPQPPINPISPISQPINPNSPISSPGLYLPPPCLPSPAPSPTPAKKQKKDVEGLWCVAKPTVAAETLQQALDFACGEGGADCDEIRSPHGICFYPDTVMAHASYALNSYWQKNKRNGGTCSFGGTAMLITTDPSYQHCRFILS